MKKPWFSPYSMPCSMRFTVSFVMLTERTEPLWKLTSRLVNLWNDFHQAQGLWQHEGDKKEEIKVETSASYHCQYVWPMRFTFAWVAFIYNQHLQDWVHDCGTVGCFSSSVVPRRCCGTLGMLGKFKEAKLAEPTPGSLQEEIAHHFSIYVFFGFVFVQLLRNAEALGWDRGYERTEGFCCTSSDDLQSLQ